MLLFHIRRHISTQKLHWVYISLIVNDFDQRLLGIVVWSKFPFPPPSNPSKMKPHKCGIAMPEVSSPPFASRNTTYENVAESCSCSNAQMGSFSRLPPSDQSYMQTRLEALYSDLETIASVNHSINKQDPVVSAMVSAQKKPFLLYLSHQTNVINAQEDPDVIVPIVPIEAEGSFLSASKDSSRTSHYS